MISIVAAVLAIGGLAVSGQVLANDTMAELRTGGLVFVESADVSMAQEELFLSMDEVCGWIMCSATRVIRM